MDIGSVSCNGLNMAPGNSVVPEMFALNLLGDFCQGPTNLHGL